MWRLLRTQIRVYRVVIVWWLVTVCGYSFKSIELTILLRNTNTFIYCEIWFYTVGGLGGALLHFRILILTKIHTHGGVDSI